MSTMQLDQTLRSIQQTLILLVQNAGTRLTRQQVCERLGVHRNTLATYVRERGFPAPGKDGKWLVSEVMEWEAMP